MNRRTIGLLAVSFTCSMTMSGAGAPAYPDQCLAQLEKKPGKEETERAGAWRQRLLENARRVKRDVEVNKLWEASPLAVYGVPAMSPHERLPDAYPIDGRITSQLRAVGARSEIFSVSCFVFPFKDIEALQLSVSDLKGKAGTIPASALDLKVVKCWYQAGTAWQSYFADPSRAVLIPELLLNDETLVRVDHETQSNYLRLDYPAGSEYLWMSYPDSLAPARPFHPLLEPFADSPTLHPVRLAAGEFKQFWITIRIPEKCQPGFYSGAVTFGAAGESIGPLALQLKVLPFELPPPRAYYDLDRDFIVSMYHYFRIDALAKRVDDLGLIRRQLAAELKNMRDHNVRQHSIGTDDAQLLDIYIQALQAADVDRDMIFGPFGGNPAVYRKEIDADDWTRFVARHDRIQSHLKKHFPQTQFYAFGVDEAGYDTLTVEDAVFRHFAGKGVSIYATAHLRNLLKAGLYNVDILATPTHPDKAREEARITHAGGGRIVVYGSPHSGVENPALIRRTHGLMPYLSDFDGVRECGYSPGMTWCNSWNDMSFFDGFRINFIYPTHGGVIDTLHWEGFREGINDVRYATRLCLLAREAIAGGKVDQRYAARKALQYLATLDWQNADLDAARLEMVHHILTIQSLMEGGQQ